MFFEYFEFFYDLDFNVIFSLDKMSEIYIVLSEEFRYKVL